MMASENEERLRQAEDLLRRCLDGFSAYIHGRKLARNQRDRLRQDMQAFLSANRKPANDKLRG